MNTAARRLVPYTLLPLSLVACMLASAPWLRAFPADLLAVPLFGAAVLSVLVPVIAVGIGVRQLWLSALIDAALLIFYELLVTLRQLGGFDEIYSGLVHGPAQILSFALPLVSPRTLLVAPVALCWVCGAIVGECVARGWQTVLPYLTLTVTFGLAYAGTARAVTSSSDGRRYDTVLAGALLLVLLLLRAAQAWVVQNESDETRQPEGVLPLRGLAVGVALAIAVAAAAAGAVQSPAFTGQRVIPARMPPVDESRPLTPVAFVSDLRPDDPTDPGEPLFKVSIDRATSNYIAIASVDYYDGDSWSFSRTFRPSGGVIPAETDPSLRPGTASVTQQYEIADGPMTSVPWMPHLDRPQHVSGVPVNIDADSGMIVPANPLRGGDDYTVVSTVPPKHFTDLDGSAVVGTAGSQLDTALPNGLADPLATLTRSLAQETGVSSQLPVPFLLAVTRQLQARTALAGLAPPGSSPSTPASGAPSDGSSGAAPSAPRLTSGAHAGGTTFADVLASIRGARSGTPEQFATLIALIARELHIPARVVSGFRVPLPQGSSVLPAGTYSVRSGAAWSWVEIPVRGLGWLVLDATPTRYAAPAPEPSAGTGRTPSSGPTPSKKALSTRSNNGGHAVAPPSRTHHGGGISTTALVVMVLVTAVAVGILLLALQLIRKYLRARRRRRGDPRRRVIGAWEESIDVLVEAGLADLSSATTSEVAAAAAARFGSDSASRARVVGQAADLAIFSPATPLAAADAEVAWRAHTAMHRSVRRTLRWPDRVVSRVRYNHPRRAATVGTESWAADAKARVAAVPGKHLGSRRGAGRKAPR